MRKAWNIKKKGAGGLKNFRKRELIINIHDTGDTSFLLSFANSGFLLFSFSFFLQIEVLWQLYVNQSLQVPFFQEHLLTSCLCHVLIILIVLQIFSLLFYLL